MATDTPTKPSATRRHPLQVTSDRLQQHLKEYPQLFDDVLRIAVDQVARRLNHAAENGLEEGPRVPAYGPPSNPGQPVDQRSGRV